MFVRAVSLAVSVFALASCSDPADRVGRKLDKVGEKAADAVERDIDIAVKQDVARRAQVHEQAEDRADVAEKNFEAVDAAAEEVKDAVLAFHKARADEAAAQGGRLNRAAEKLNGFEVDVKTGHKKMKAGYDAAVAVAKGSLAAAHQEVAGLAAVDEDAWKTMKARAEAAVDAAEDAVGAVGDNVD